MRFMASELWGHNFKVVVNYFLSAAMPFAKQSWQRSLDVLLPCTQDYRLGPFPTTKVAEWVDGCEACSDKASYRGPAHSQSLLTHFLAILHFGHPKFFALSLIALLANHLLQIVKSSESKSCLLLYHNGALLRIFHALHFVKYQFSWPISLLCYFPQGVNTESCMKCHKVRVMSRLMLWKGLFANSH